MAHATIRNLTNIACNVSKAGLNGMLKQGLKRNGVSSMKGVMAELAASSKHQRTSNATLQNIIKAAGNKSKQKFNISDMQRCLATMDLISNVSTICIGSSTSDSDMLEGSEDGDDVCSQGKQHSRRTVCTAFA